MSRAAGSAERNARISDGSRIGVTTTPSERPRDTANGTSNRGMSARSEQTIIDEPYPRKLRSALQKPQRMTRYSGENFSGFQASIPIYPRSSTEQQHGVSFLRPPTQHFLPFRGLVPPSWFSYFRLSSGCPWVLQAGKGGGSYFVFILLPVLLEPGWDRTSFRGSRFEIRREKRNCSG